MTARSQYTHAKALQDLLDQIRAMRERSEQYKVEAEADGNLDAGGKHARVLCVLKELERLGRLFQSSAEDAK